MAPAPALSLWLARARVTAFPPAWCEQALAALCGHDDSRPPPVAALTYREDFGEQPPGACLRADPVHLRADTRGLLLFDPASFALDAAAAQALIETLDAHLADDGWRLVGRHPQRWYLLGERAPQLCTAPLPTVRGTPVATTPYVGDDARRWTGRVNELQMLMHNHAVNSERAAQGKPAVNSVWLWGEGEWHAGRGTPYTHLAADTVFARAVARCGGCESLDLPQRAEAVAGDLPARADVLVVLEDCRDAAAYEDPAGWQAALERLERDWFAPLLTALRRRQVDALELLPLNGRRYRLTRSGLRALWRGRGDYAARPGFRQPAANRV